ncbi:hydroxyacylglutathione hydrolase [Alteromonas flava]|uniref:hydroxyacylglutathione hydrolase n=1 Tax=Alteromonas flava TaxID=2048003 RepID=UPI000C29499A|nr:hydroxyacylglutathione hydrolase [Alteromonas flava]
MSTALPTGVSITPIPAFVDNYIWCFYDDKRCVVVDPGDAKPVVTFCQQHQLELTAVLITHHHADHTGGLPELCKHWPGLRVIGPQNPKITHLNETVTENDSVEIKQLGLLFKVIEIPGHTLDHIGFIGHGGVLCGDTLFSAGCGRLFEGSPEQMRQSLAKLSALPDTTLVWCTHEYTLANMDFARAVEPNNAALMERLTWAQTQREADQPTLPSKISIEKAINPFLRSHSAEIQQSVQRHENRDVESELEVFTAVRAWKDNF